MSWWVLHRVPDAGTKKVHCDSHWPWSIHPSPMCILRLRGGKKSWCIDPHQVNDWHKGEEAGQITIPEFTKERYLSRVAKARALVPLREKFAHFLFSSYLFFYFIFHILCYISVSHKVCSFQWCQKFDMLHWEIKIGSQNGDSEWLCKIQPYPRVQNQWLSSQSRS